MEGFTGRIHWIDLPLVRGRGAASCLPQGHLGSSSFLLLHLGPPPTRWGLVARLGQEMMGDQEPKFSPDERTSCGGVPGVWVMGPPKHPVG